MSVLVLLTLSCAGSGRKAGLQSQRDLALFEAAERMFADSEYEHAFLLYEKYLSAYPQGAMAPAAMLRKGVVLAEIKKYENARLVYAQLIRQFPGTDFCLRAQIGVLLSYLRQQRYDAVLDYAGKLDKKRFAPGMAMHISLAAGDAWMVKKDLDQAFGFYMEAFFQASEAGKVHAGRRLVQAAARLKPDRLNALCMRLGDGPPAGYLVYGKGLALLQAGRISEAAGLLSDFSNRFPGHPLSGEAMEKIRQINQMSFFEGQRIGVLVPLTGEYSLFGKSALRGIELALEAYHEQNRMDSPVEILVYDTGAGEKGAATGVEVLAAQNIAAIVGLIVAAGEAAKEAEKRRIPFIALSQKSGITESGEYVFRNFITPQAQVETLVQYAMAKLGLERFAVVYPDEPYGKTFLDLFEQTVARRGGTLAGAEAYDPEETDFSEAIKKMGKIRPDPEKDRRYIAGVDFDAVFIPDSARTAGLIIPQLRYYDINDVWLLGTHLWHSEQLVKIAGGQISRVVIPEGFYAQSRRKEVKSFVDRFRAKYEGLPGIIEASGYDSAMMLFELIANPDIKDRIALKNALYDMSGFPGVTGEIAFDKTGEAVKDLYLIEIIGGRFVAIQ